MKISTISATDREVFMSQLDAALDAHERRWDAGPGDSQRYVSKLESSLVEYREALAKTQKQLADERSRNAFLSAQIMRLQRVHDPDPHGWGLQPGVGL